MFTQISNDFVSPRLSFFSHSTTRSSVILGPFGSSPPCWHSLRFQAEFPRYEITLTDSKNVLMRFDECFLLVYFSWIWSIKLTTHTNSTWMIWMETVAIFDVFWWFLAYGKPGPKSVDENSVVDRLPGCWRNLALWPLLLWGLHRNWVAFDQANRKNCNCWSL